jgi:SdpC family antimicrobial peptide
MPFKTLLYASLACFMLVSCGSANLIHVNTSDNASLYLSVFFEQGELGSQITKTLNPKSDMSARDTKRNTTLETIGKQSLKEIIAKDADFLNHFGTELRSGNPVRVEKVLLETRVKLNEILSLNTKVNLDRINGWAIAVDKDGIAISTSEVFFYSETVAAIMMQGMFFDQSMNSKEHLLQDTVIQTVTLACYQPN